LLFLFLHSLFKTVLFLSFFISSLFLPLLEFTEVFFFFFFFFWIEQFLANIFPETYTKLNVKLVIIWALEVLVAFGLVSYSYEQLLPHCFNMRRVSAIIMASFISVLRLIITASDQILVIGKLILFVKSLLFSFLFFLWRRCVSLHSGLSSRISCVPS
jgi:hypothetical protein